MSLQVRIYRDRFALGAAAAADGKRLIQQAIGERGRARVIFSAANSQLEMIGALTRLDGIDWSRVEVFHVDEYVGVSSAEPISFARWIREQVAERVTPKVIHYIRGEAADPVAESARYAELLAEAPIDVSFLGIGENGHIGFNDPHEADFHDAFAVRTVTLDVPCREQQVAEGHFRAVEEMPGVGYTLTCPTLVAAREVICCVSNPRKARAVRDALEGPLGTACPASILRTHASAVVYLDREAAALLQESYPCEE